MSSELNLQNETVQHAHPADAIVVAPEDSVRTALEQMKQFKTGNVLVCDKEQLVGIFTERDALKLLTADGDLEQAVSNIMTRDPVTVSLNDSVGSAIAKMSTGGYRRLPVVDQTGKSDCILKISGIIHYLVEHVQDVVYTLPPEPHHRTKTREGA